MASEHKLKLLVFAAAPPPHHGQSYAVQLLLGGLHEKPVPGNLGTGIEVYHVNARFSEDLQQVGFFRWAKVFHLIGYCIKAIWFRLKFGAKNFYYIPAPGRRVPLYRDWLVMLLCRPFFSRITFHWQAAGLGEWLRTQARPWEAWITRKLMGGHFFSIVLGDCGRADASELQALHCAVVPNGIPDPCPAFESQLRLKRQARAASLRQCVLDRSGTGLEFVNVLFMALCTREKGLFDCLRGVALFNQQMSASGSRLRAVLHVAGTFPNSQERMECEVLAADCGFEWRLSSVAREDSPAVYYHGFVEAEAKRRLLEACDIFCFPTFYSAEAFPFALIEAMAYNLPVLVTPWRCIPEMLPANYVGIVKIRDPRSIALGLFNILNAKEPSDLRAHFLAGFTDRHYVGRILAILEES